MTYGSREGTAWQFLFMQYSWQQMSGAVQNTNQKVPVKDLLLSLHCQTIYSEKEAPDSSLSFACLEDEDLTEMPLSPQGLSFPEMSRSQILRQEDTMEINSFDYYTVRVACPWTVTSSSAFQLLEHPGKSLQTHRCSPPAKPLIYSFCRRCCHTESAGAELESLCISSHSVHHQIAAHKLCTVPRVVLEEFPSSSAAFCCPEGPALPILNRKKP